MTVDAVNFKGYLQINGVKSEVRRFVIEKDVVTSFCYMQEKLSSIFPSLKNTSFRIFWKDSEGDEVAVNSDDELFIALCEMQGHEVKKIYVSNDGKNIHNSAGPVHEGIECDSCDGVIVGFRYKCVVCSNFDLCSKCESMGLHAEHFMLRIPIPINSSLNREFGHKFGRWSHKLNKKFGGGCPIVDSSGNRCRAGRFPNNSRSEGAEGGVPREPHAGGGEGAPRCSLSPYDGWFEHLTAFINDFMPPPAASHIRQGIASFLDPLGGVLNANGSRNQGPMDQDNGESSKKEQSKEKSDRSSGDAMETEVPNSSSNGSNQHKVADQDVVNQKKQKESPSKSSESKEQPENNNNAKTNSAGVQKESIKVYPNVNEVHQSPATRFSPPPDPSWAIIDRNTGQEQQLNSAQASHGTPMDEGEIRDPIVEDALSKMLSMGFNNEGDWLRQLLICKGGDIEQVLDTLMPIRKYTPK